MADPLFRAAPLAAKLAWFHRALNDPELSAHERLVAAAMFDCHNTKTGRLDPGVSALQARTGLSRSSVLRALGDLVGRKDPDGRAAYLERARRFHDAGGRRLETNAYRLAGVEFGAAELAAADRAEAAGPSVRETLPSAAETLPSVAETPGPSVTATRKPVDSGTLEGTGAGAAAGDSSAVKWEGATPLYLAFLQAVIAARGRAFGEGWLGKAVPQLDELGRLVLHLREFDRLHLEQHRVELAGLARRVGAAGLVLDSLELERRRAHLALVR